jgi:hypothetical protein
MQEMKRILSLLLCAAVFPAIAHAEEDDWGFVASVTYGPRAIAGTIFANRPGPAMGGATADSLGLGTANSFMYAAGFRFKRWNFTLDSMPTTFDGQGFATAAIDLGNGQAIAITTPIISTINVDLKLANVMYDVFNTEKGKFSAGMGFGQTAIDVALVPAIGQSVAFNGTTPFGFLAINYVKRFNKFSLTVAAQGIALAVNESSMDYSNLNLMGGYMFFKKKWFSEVVIGYRRVGFKFDYDVAAGIFDTDMTLTGPYVGLVGGF